MGNSKRRGAMMAGAAGLALLTAACGGSSGSTGAAASSSGIPLTGGPLATTGAGQSSVISQIPAVSASGSVAQPADAAGATFDCSYYKKNWPNISGKSIHVYTSIVAPEDQPQIESYKPFEDCTGAKVNYEGSKDFEAQLIVRVKSGNSPDIAYIPQPGLLAAMVATGKVAKPAQQTVDTAQYGFSQDWINYGTVNGTFYAAPLGANVKSFVWYSPKQFKKNGYQVPQTWADLMTLTDKIAADHPDAKPWCAGFGSGDATGWPGTDWVEELMLRTAGPDVYDQWVTHKIPFNDPKVVNALNEVGKILKNDKYVNGGFGDHTTIATTTFQDAGQPILGDNPQCYLHQQASFYAANWPQGTDVSQNGDVFAFYEPPMGSQFGKPVEGGGEFVAAFANRPEVQAFQTYLASGAWANAKAKVSSGWVSANRHVDLNNFKNPIDRLSAQILQDPNATFRFDGSDAMPAKVGAGTFWTGMVNWITGKSTKDTLDAIENSWPSS